LTLGFFSWSKSIYYCDLSLTNCTFVKLELRVQGHISTVTLGNLTDVVALNWEFGASGYITEPLQACLGSDSGVHSYGDYGIAAIKLVTKIKLIVSSDMYRNYLDYHTSVW